MIKDTNFLEYTGVEEQNFLTSLVNFREEFDLFGILDNIYKKPLERLEIKPDESVIGQLYLFVHFHLYFSISCFMRAHLSEALASMRKAIDGALSAYEIILSPNSTKAYLDKKNPDNKNFIHIKNYLKEKMAKDKSAYPLAHQLIKLHEGCSQFGSHADIDSFAHRLEIKDIHGEKKDQLLMHYFQLPKNSDESKFYFIIILLSFWHMFTVFKVFFDKKFKILDPRWEKVVGGFGPKLNELRESYRKKF